MYVIFSWDTLQRLCAFTIQQPTAVLGIPQLEQDEPGDDVIRYQVTLVKTGFHQEPNLCMEKQKVEGSHIHRI